MINTNLVARVIADDVIELVARLHGRGRHVETAAPDLHLNKIKRWIQTLLMTMQTCKLRWRHITCMSADYNIMELEVSPTCSSPCLAAVSALLRPVRPP